MYLTLELPKRIINDAIGSGGDDVPVWGYDFTQIQFLALLCGGFLVSVLAHGLLKMRINTIKGVLAERMLRRFRYTLVARILRFPQPYFRRTSQGELVSMVTSEAEPLGGMMGDAITQPVLQLGQMLTILSFLFLQNLWFGLAAVALIPLQAWIIPRLQRQINLLNKARIKQVRQLASEIGESAAGASSLRTNGGWRYRLAVITDRLGKLFDIRFEIYQKKFFMKFLNNFITQLTPFFFFSIGGYLVIVGNVSLGALVAALAAYKDLSSPWKELLAYYNQSQDMSLRWEVITERFAPAGMVEEDLFDGEQDPSEHIVGAIELNKVSVRDLDGNNVLEDINLTIPASATVAIAAPSEEDRRAIAELLTREITPTQGRVKIAGRDLNQLHQNVIASRIGHASSRPYMFQGTVGDNVLMPLKTSPRIGGDGDNSDSLLTEKLHESMRAGNSGDPLDANWVNPEVANMQNEEDVRDWWLKLVESTGSADSLLLRGMSQRLDEKRHHDLAQKLVATRPLVAKKINEAGLAGMIHRIDWNEYNPALPVGGNLLFASPRWTISQKELAAQTGFADLLRELKLEDAIIGLSREVMHVLLQTFGLDGTDHPLFRKLGIDTEVYEQTVSLVMKNKSTSGEEMTQSEKALLMTVPFRVSADQIGPAFTDDIKDQILGLRAKACEMARDRMGDLFVPFDPDTYAPGLTVLENAIYGKISGGAGAHTKEIEAIVANVLKESGLSRLSVEMIYDMPTELGGGNLPATYAERLAFCRAGIKRPDILIMDRALASYDHKTRQAASLALRKMMPETTFFFLEDKFEHPEDYDMYVEIQHGRVISKESGRADTDADDAPSADLTAKLRSLETAELFEGLDRKQLRLMAFGARWYTANAGEYIFRKGDEPTDGAYLLVDGEAGLYLPYEGHDDELISTVTTGRLVGDLALLTDETRFLDMRAHTDIKALRIGKEEFLAVVESDAATAFRLLQVVAGYLTVSATSRRREEESETDSAQDDG